MFVSAETVVQVGFAAARTGLAAVADGGWLASASGDAYGQWGKGLARVGPRGSARGISRLVEVRFRELTPRGKSATLTFRWEAAGPGGGLFPVLDADLVLAPFGESASLLALAGVYRPPLGAMGAALDRAVLRRVADATLRGFLTQVGKAVVRLSVRAEAV
jgi:hypothetical protein